MAIETPDSSTVVIKLSAPNSEFLNQSTASFFAVINSDVASANGAISDETAAEKDSSEEWFSNSSAGSGPFVLAGYEPNAELRLKRNDAYWRNKPAVQEVIMRHVTEAIVQAQMLQSGEVDIAMQIDPETAKIFEGTSIVTEPAPSYNFIYMAISPGAKNLPVKLTPEVREAISMAVDRTALIDFTLGGAGRLLSAPIPPGFPGADGHPLPIYDPEKAKKILAAAGLGDGFTLEAIYPDQRMFGVDFNVMMQKIQQDLAKIDVILELKPMPVANWREAANGDHIPLTAVYYSPDFFGSSQYVDIFGMQEGSVWAHRAGGENDPSILNPRANERKVQALAASTPYEIEKLWSEAATEMIHDRIIFPLMSPNMILAHGANVKGLRFSICCNPPLAEIEN